MTAPTRWLLDVAVDAPRHSAIGGHLLTYCHSQALPPGTLVRVPLGRREVLGVVWGAAMQEQRQETAGITLREIIEVLGGIAPLPDAWRSLIEFTARYYQRSVGEVALMALPGALGAQTAAQWNKRLTALERRRAQPGAPQPGAATPSPPLQLSGQQQGAFDALRQGANGVSVLYGATGSGKSEVYLRYAAHLLAVDPRAQVLFLVPEINLAPQWQALLLQRFEASLGPQCVAVMHSGLTPVQRLTQWLAVHQGHTRVVLGTRLSVLASFAKLALIVVDEEHDPSYKQQDGARYHARDLAVWLGHRLSVPVVLGSATPSLESWHNSRPAHDGQPAGPYQRLCMPERIGGGALAALRVVDMRQQPRTAGLAAPLLAAMRARMAAGEQCMVLLNRRGWAPVLQCAACGWKSECPHCSAHQVLHRAEHCLRCHHCGWTTPQPRHCPRCASIDLAPVGRGTEQLEKLLEEELGALALPDGRQPRVLRVDADSTRQKGALQESLARVHGGEIDILVGTQMIAKGHDFRRIGLVAVVQPDGALYSADFRAPERLFALLMQAAGRAGRDSAYMHKSASQPELWLQTSEPGHPLYAALARHDYPGFAAAQLREREQAGMPPFSYQALLRADARSQQVAQDFLRGIAAAAAACAMPGADRVTVYPPLPLPVQRVANAERAQMLLESSSRQALQAYLRALQPLLQQARRQAPAGLLRWLIDVDPPGI